MAERSPRRRGPGSGSTTSAPRSSGSWHRGPDREVQDGGRRPAASSGSVRDRPCGRAARPDRGNAVGELFLHQQVESLRVQRGDAADVRVALRPVGSRDQREVDGALVHLDESFLRARRLHEAGRETVPRQRPDECARDHRPRRVHDSGRQRDAANGGRRSGHRDRQRDAERRQPEDQPPATRPAVAGETWIPWLMAGAGRAGVTVVAPETASGTRTGSAPSTSALPAQCGSAPRVPFAPTPPNAQAALAASRAP